MKECFPDLVKDDAEGIKLANKMMSAGYFHGAAWGPERKIKRKDGTIKVGPDMDGQRAQTKKEGTEERGHGLDDSALPILHSNPP